LFIFQPNQQYHTLLPITPCVHKLKAGIAYNTPTLAQFLLRHIFVYLKLKDVSQLSLKQLLIPKQLLQYL
jgi:hypothetical protein